MGMFDYLRCGYPLPRPEFSERNFQTKDFQEWPNLDQLRIDKDGRLLQRRCSWDNNEDRIWPEIQTDFTGTLAFYDFERYGNINKEDLGWVEFLAEFDSGKLTDLQLAILRSEGINIYHKEEEHDSVPLSPEEVKEVATAAGNFILDKLQEPSILEQCMGVDKVRES